MISLDGGDEPGAQAEDPVRGLKQLALHGPGRREAASSRGIAIVSNFFADFFAFHFNKIAFV